MKKYKPIKSDEKPLISNKIGALCICFVMTAVIFSLFLISILDTDKTVSEKENRTLKARPSVSISAVGDGSFMKDFDEYFADTFPFRDRFLDINSRISKLFSQNRSSSAGDMVIVDVEGKDDFDGQSID